jgi:hypothetical protein
LVPLGGARPPAFDAGRPALATADAASGSGGGDDAAPGSVADAGDVDAAIGAAGWVDAVTLSAAPTSTRAGGVLDRLIATNPSVSMAMQIAVATNNGTRPALRPLGRASGRYVAAD